MSLKTAYLSWPKGKIKIRSTQLTVFSKKRKRANTQGCHYSELPYSPHLYKTNNHSHNPVSIIRAQTRLKVMI